MENIGDWVAALPELAPGIVVGAVIGVVIGLRWKDAVEALGNAWVNGTVGAAVGGVAFYVLTELS